MDFNSSQIMTSVATKIVEDSIKVSWEKVKGFFKDLSAMDSIRYGEAYSVYLSSTKSKYGKIKTLIYRHEPKELYSFYECVGVKCGGKNVDTSDISNLISITNKIIITGTGGIGKSVLLKHLFLNTIDNTNYIPVLLELRRLNSETGSISIKKSIYDALINNGFNLEEKYFENSLKDGAYIFLFDGLDEVNIDRLDKVTKEIRDFSDSYSHNKYIIASRPSEKYIGWNDFTEMHTLSLSKKQALNLVSKLEYDKTIKDVFYLELKNSLYNKYRSFASNPLLLNIMLLTFNNHASIPDKLNDFYEMAFATLFNMHDATKDAYVRDIRTKLSCEDFKHVFAYICFKSYFRSEFEFSETLIRRYIDEAKNKIQGSLFTVDDYLDDLTKAVCMLIKDGLSYRFVHRSFQEYFAAWYTCKLTDDIQKKLITRWLRESNLVFSDSYLSMLFNLQSDKVNQIVFTPGLKTIKKKLEELGRGLNLCRWLFKGICLREKVVGEEGDRRNEYSLSLSMKNQYYCAIIMLSCRLNRYSYPEFSDDYSVGRDLHEAEEQFNLVNDYITFDDAISIVGENRLTGALEWFFMQLDFALSVMENSRKNAIRSKRSVSSIIDEI